MDDEGAWEAVFFGVGGVILDPSSIQQGHREFIEEFINEFRPDVPLETAIDQWQAGVNEYLQTVNAAQHQSAREAYASGVAALVGEPLDPSDWWPMYEDAISENAEPMPGAKETIVDLDTTGIHLGIISNLDAAETERYLGLLGVRSPIDSVTTAEQVNNRKPHPVIFRRALQSARVEATGSLMVGDHYEEDMRGAKNIEMNTVAIGQTAATRDTTDPFIDYVLASFEELLTIIDAPESAE